jgi:hypothetical protein
VWTSAISPDARRAHLTVEENATIMKMHFRRKTAIEETKFTSVDYRIYANAQMMQDNLSESSDA